MSDAHDRSVLASFERLDIDIAASYLTQSFHEQRQIDVFIRNSKVGEILRKEAENLFINQVNGPENFKAIVIKLPLIYSDLLHHSADLVHLLIEEPVQFKNAIKYCAFALLRDIVRDLSKAQNSHQTANIDIDQVHLLLRFVGLPIQKDLCFQPHSQTYRTDLSEVIGVLVAIAKPEKVVLQSIWYCSTGCERNKIRTHSLEVPLCRNCGHSMKEYSKLRYTQNFYFVRILPFESIEPPKTINKIFRALSVRVSEHVFDCELKLGKRYLIVGHYNYISQKE